MEPGETQEFQLDFIIDDEVQAIKVASNFIHPILIKPVVSWNCVDIYKIKE